VEETANTIRDYDILHGHATEDCSVEGYVEVAKQILSHPDLTLIEGDENGLLTLEQYLDAHNIHLGEQEKFRKFFEGEVKIDLKAQKFLTINKLRQAVHDSREGKELDLSEEAFEVFNMIKNDGLNEHKDNIASIFGEIENSIRELANSLEKGSFSYFDVILLRIKDIKSRFQEEE